MTNSGDSPIAETDYGTLRGRWVDDEVMRFADVPFAAPPVGDRRFKPPVDPEPWDGVRDATEFGPVCPQPIRDPDDDVITADRLDEDCLRLNVWTRGVEGDRPVMVWIHGGGYTTGSGASYDGTGFAKRGDVVLVTINYRLGPFGGLYLRDVGGEAYRDSHNNQTLDQRQALRWVRENADAFGGDPDNVTVFGESAGATSVMTLMVSSNAGEFMDGAIAQSTSFYHRTVDRASEVTSEFMDYAGVDDLDVLLALDTGEIMETYDAYAADNPAIRNALFRPVLDGELLPEEPYEAFAEGETADIPLVHGSAKHEYNFYVNLSPDELADATVEDLRRAIKPLYSLTDEEVDAMVEAVRADNPDADEAQVCYDVLTQTFRQAHRDLADLRVGRGDSWMYLFAWESPVDTVRAGHTIEIPFVFHDFSGREEFIGENPPEELADVVQDAWVAFARDGDPNHDGLPEWPRYHTERRPVLRFDTEPEVVYDPEPACREVWSDIDLPDTVSVPRVF